MQRSYLLLVILLGALSTALAAPPANLPATLEQMIAPLLATADYQHARFGMEIASIDDHTIWYSRAAQEMFIPASTTKIATTTLALEMLSPDYRFTTRLLTDGHVTDVDHGAFSGNLILQGGGDPLFSVDDLRALAHLFAIGDARRALPPIFLLTGRLLLDESYFPCRGPQLGRGWEAEDLPWSFAAPSSALSCDENAVGVSVHGSIPGEPALVELTPATAQLRISNEAVTTEANTAVTCSIIPDGSQVTVQGTLTPTATLQAKLSLPAPQRFVLEQFAADLQTEGITWNEATGDAPPGKVFRLLALHNSPPLREVIRPMLKNSDNHLAEQLRWALLAHCGVQRNQVDKAYAALLTNFCRQAQLPRAEFCLVDGSGLSRQNRISPSAMTQLLEYIAATPYAGIFADALPVAGVDGTLKTRMGGTPAEKDAHAKTGTMTGVCALAGYVTTQSGEHLVFTIFLNGYQGHAGKARALQDAIVAYLAGLP